MTLTALCLKRMYVTMMSIQFLCKRSDAIMAKEIVLARYVSEDIKKQALEDGIYLISELENSNKTRNFHIINLLKYLHPLVKKVEKYWEDNPIDKAILDENKKTMFYKMLEKINNEEMEEGERIPLAFSKYDIALIFIRIGITVYGKKTVLKVLAEYDVDYAKYSYGRWMERIRKIDIKPMFYNAEDVEIPKITGDWAE